MARIRLAQVNKIYRSRGHTVHAVKDLDLTVEDGEFVAILGPSGCGKTSTLRMIVGLEEITSGDIFFDDRRVNDLDPQGRNVAMAFETYALYPSFTVEENLSFPLEVRGVPAAARRKQVRDVAALLRIEDILAQRPGALSGGQQQRVSLGRALIRDPAVFILDEVMSHIDAHLKLQMLFELKRIHQELGKTMIYVTHDQVEALALADRVAVMSNATLQQVGTRNELYHMPVNVFVADFIGEPPTNFFPAELDCAGEQPVLRAKGAALAFAVPPARGRHLAERGQRDFIVGLRPQNLHLDGADGADGADGGRGGRDAALHAEVAINEYVGEQTILTLVADGYRFRAQAHAETRLGRGDRARLRYAREDVMVFDAQTEALIA